jgi:hypothetical protein
MHFEVDAIAQVTSVPVARGEQLACLFGRFRLHTPLAGHKHDGVEHLQLGCGLLFQCSRPKGAGFWVVPK